MTCILERAAAEKSAKDSARKQGGAPPKRKKQPAECREVFANFSEYLDGRMEPSNCEQMRKHIEKCPACVAFLRDLRAAIDRCRQMEMPCDAAIALRMRSALTREYLRMLGMPTPESLSAAV